MTSNFINTDMASLIRLHNLSLIDDKTFTEAVKKLNSGRAYPQPAISSPLSPTINRPDPNHINVPFIQRGGSGTGYISNDTPYIAKYFSTSGGVTGIAVPDIHSGSVLKPETVEVVEYSENRDHLPEHAQMVLNWIDEAWKDKVDEYNETKNDWQRIQYTDEEGNEIVEWIEKIKAEKELEAYKTFLEDNVVVEGDDAQLNGLQHIFNLSIGKDEC